MPASVVRYSPRSVVLHWGMAIVIAVTIGLGLSLARAPDGWGDTLYRLHWSFGMTALALATVRLANRLGSGVPPVHPTLTPVESLLSNLVHKALYFLMFIVPILGWLGKSAYGGAITIFGLFDMPALVGENEAMAKTWLLLHKAAVFAFMGCLALHIAGALNHALIKRDGVIERMTLRR